MKRFLVLLALCVTFTAVNVMIVPVWADDTKAPDKSDSKPEAQKGATKGGGAGEKNPDNASGGRFAGDPVYVHLDPIVLPVISDAGIEQLVTVVIDIEAKDLDASANIHAQMPRVMDALMTSLYGGLGRGNLRNGKLVDVSKLKAKATTAVQNVVGEDAVKNVLIQGVAQRML